MPHDHSAPHSAQDRATHLSEAERRCSDAGESLTPLRRRVLELLMDHHGPAKAYDLLSQLDAGAKPPTIYRALDFLVRMGLAHRIESPQCVRGVRSRRLRALDDFSDLREVRRGRRIRRRPRAGRSFGSRQPRRL
ncbi:MAG: hypothetical protein WDM79_10225 [Terricaulis sp.]